MCSRLLTLARGRAGLSRKLPIWSSASLSSAQTFNLPDDMFLLHKLESGPNMQPELTRQQCLDYYGQMVRVREMEMAAREMYGNKVIRGFLHLYVGQEACSTGIEAAITPEDPVITAYRCHGWTFTRGASMKEILSELAGRNTGVARGKGGSMHMYADNFYGGNGIVGAQVPLGAGIAFTLKYQNSDRICLTLYGDGAANQGQVFEAFNMAALWKLPCLFICENNLYGMGTSQDRASASSEFYKRGDYIPGIQVEGQNVLAVREATKFCADYIRAGNGPLVMELNTYRYFGHSMSDPGKSYRDSNEVKEQRAKRDPISRLVDYGLDGDLVTQDELKDVRKKIMVEVQEAVKFALESSELPENELFTDIYVNQGDLKVRGCDPFTGYNPQ